jgi:putative glutathione S-transferase
VRQASRFRDVLGAEGAGAEAGRYHLYISAACPWSQRAMIVRVLHGLEGAISMSEVDPVRDDRGWAFTEPDFSDPVNGFGWLSQAYEATDPGFDGRVSVPVLWDRQQRQIVNNESADLVRFLGSAFHAVAEHPVDLYPLELRAEIDELNERIYETVNNGVYRAGFARSQPAYDMAFDALFETLDELEQRLSDRRYLLGDRLTEADWRLFPTLVRFDSVYHVHFKCNRRRLVDYPSLWGYTRELYAQPGIAATVNMDHIKRHYFCTHPMINPSRLIARGPELDFTAPHDRASVSQRHSGEPR